MADQPMIDFGELGRTGLRRAAGIIDEEFLRQLSGMLGRKAFREMSENDAIIGALLFALEMLMRPVTWNAEPGGPNRDDQERADQLLTMLDDMSHTWTSFIGEWMAAPVYGFAPFETVFKRRDGAKSTPGETSRYTDGLIGIRKLAIRHPDTLERWLYPEGSDEIIGLVQRAPPDWRLIEIPIEKLLLFTVMQRKGSPEGTSLLRRAYVSWYRKKHIEQVEAIGIERELAGLPVFKVPPEWLRPDATTEHRQLLEYTKTMGKRLRSDDQSCVVIPALYDSDGHELYTFSLSTTGGRRAIDTSQAKEYYSRQAAMTVMGDVILLGHEKVGSFALASSKTNLFSAGIGALLDDLGAVINRHLVPRIAKLNGWPMDRLPKLTHGDVESIDLAELGDYITKLSGAGMVLFPTESGDLERHLLQAANLPGDPGLPQPADIPKPGDDDQGDPKNEEDEDAKGPAAA